MRDMEKKRDLCDGVICVLDARAPIATVNKNLKKIFGAKPILYVLNKADLADGKADAFVKFFEDRGCYAVKCDSTNISTKRVLLQRLNAITEEKRERALTMIGYGKYMLATVRTLRNARRYRLEGLKGKNASRATLAGILQEEADNVRELMPWVERDSSLGFEPAMRYVTDVKMLKWKLKQLENEKKNLERKGSVKPFF